MKSCRRFFLLLVLLHASFSFAYRFVCNGVLANGEERSDACGVCNEETAARWDNPNIAVVVGESPLPKGISLEEWQKVVHDSFAAWENVGGTSLKFVELNTENSREFGANDSLHEIFWITDRQEWRKLIGSGEFGTLGATLPRYVCNDSGPARVIFDADLALNGLAHINWQVDCNDDECISIQTTLVHELGHFFGLDHPCLMCSASVMSARAGFDLVTPMFDDMEGLRVLYPHENRRGEFGFPCVNDKDCQEDFLCSFDGVNRYCTKSCENDGECEQGAICNSVGAKKICTFVDAKTAGGRVLGENCMRAPCVEPLVCAGAQEPNFFCFLPCENNLSCEKEEECIKIEEKLSLCVGIKYKGDLCNHRVLCAEELYCVFDSPSQGYCRSPCQSSETASTGCEPGEQCQMMEERVELCMPAEENLLLDDNADEFGKSDGVDKRDDSTGEKQLSETPAGCNDGKSQPLLMLLVFLGVTVLRRFGQSRERVPKRIKF